jgi:hypothetical protein
MLTNPRLGIIYLRPVDDMSSSATPIAIVDLKIRAIQAGATLHGMTMLLIAGTTNVLRHREVLLSFFVCILLLVPQNNA